MPIHTILGRVEWLEMFSRRRNYPHNLFSFIYTAAFLQVLDAII